MKLRVPLYGSANKIVWVDDEATKGAVAGLNLFLSDGKTLVTDDMLTGGSSGGATATLTTTDDLNEGAYHLYFTSRRAQDAVGGIVGDSANVTLTYTGGTSLVADLTDVTVTSGGSLKKRTFDAKGRLSQESAATTDDLAEGATNLYFTSARVLATTLTGLSTSTATAVTASDSVLVGIGKLQAQASANATAIAGKESIIAAGTTAQYWRGDKSWRDFATDVRAAVLTGLSTATSTVIAATDTVLGALGKLQAQITDNLLPAGYIDGLQMQWVSGTALTVTSGAAYIQGLGKVLRSTSAIAKTGLSLTASTWYHVYLYNNAGTPDVEIVTTAPDTAYSGTARTKTGDTSRRYLGSVLTDGSGAIYRFLHAGDAMHFITPRAAPFRCLNGGSSGSRASGAVDLSPVMPETATVAMLQVVNTGSNQLFLDVPESGLTSTVTIDTCTGGQRIFLEMPTLSRAMIYFYAVTSGSAAFIDVRGYRYGR
jgi:hypothetical protein